MIQHYRFRLKGVTFHDIQPRLAYLQTHPDTTIHFEREATNAYDHNAIQAIADIGSPVCIGYVPKEFAAIFAPLLDNHCIQMNLDKAIIIGGDCGKSFGCIVDVTIIES